jgi:hypothetical protein
MLRLVVLLLVLLNAAYFAWSHGMLRAYGWAPVEQSEPQRLTQQLRSEAIRILPPEEGRRAEQVALTPPKPPECLAAGLFDETQTETLRKALEGLLPPAAWTLEVSVEPARWIIYMGKFPNTAAQDKKRAELEKMKLKLYPVENIEYQPGLSLGRFDTEAQAQAELGALQKRGVRTARVLQERAELKQAQLRLPVVDEAMKARLEEVKPLLGDKALRVCK